MHIALSICLSAAVAVTATSNDCLSAVSWNSSRLDIFGLTPDERIWHKWWTPDNGIEPGELFQDLGGNLVASPVAVSWAPGRLDLFAIDDVHRSVHKYWDGSNWAELEYLGGFFEGRVLAATAWSANRLDVVGLDGNLQLSHLYWDGSQWSTWTSFGGYFYSEPSVTSWGENRLDIFGIDQAGKILHQYWSGESWLSDWEALPGPVKFVGTPVSSSMTLGRLDLWVAGVDGKLYHTFWAPGFYSGWESLGGDFITAPDVIHWSDNRIDIVGQFIKEKQYRYKFWDGHQWNPSHDDWYPKGGNFYSQPALASRGDGNLNIFGIDVDGSLKWQFWNEGQWLPSSMEYYSLGQPAYNGVQRETQKSSGDLESDSAQVVLNGYKDDI